MDTGCKLDLTGYCVAISWLYTRVEIVKEISVLVLLERENVRMCVCVLFKVCYRRMVTLTYLLIQSSESRRGPEGRGCRPTPIPLEVHAAVARRRGRSRLRVGEVDLPFRFVAIAST